MASYYTKGDNIPLTLIAKLNNVIIDLTGASLETTFKKTDGGTLVITNSDHYIGIAIEGQYRLILSSAQTLDILAESPAMFKTVITNGASKTTIWFDNQLNIRDPDIKKQARSRN